MENKIELKIPKKQGDVYLKMNVPEEMKTSGLSEIIGAREIKECNTFSGHKEPEKLYDHAKYNVSTDNFDRTLNLIRDYTHRD
jgi:hypothetical protein